MLYEVITVKIFGRVPLVLTSSKSDGNDFYVRQTSEDSVLTQIISDLNIARITSYNVCYTKLFRIRYHPIQDGWSPEQLKHMTIVGSYRPEDITETDFLKNAIAFKSVITSYSIHYTKLYDWHRHQ